MPTFEITPAIAVPAADLHAAFGTAFADYLIGPFQVTLEHWPRFLSRQGVDLAESRVALEGSSPLAFALAAPRADVGSWRLATMGAVPAARGSGAAPVLLDDFISRAQAAGAVHVELECFAQNSRALRLYDSRGFEPVCPLHGHRRDPAAPDPAHEVPPANPVREVDVAQAFALLQQRTARLPLQLTPPSLGAVPGPLRAHRCDTAVALHAPGPDTIAIWCLDDDDPAQAGAQAIVSSLLQSYPDRGFAVPQLLQEVRGGGALQRLGFTRQPLHQLWMRRLFSPAT